MKQCYHLMLGKYDKYSFLMSDKERKNYVGSALLYAGILAVVVGMFTFFLWGFGQLSFSLMALGFLLGLRIPCLLLNLRFKQQSNEIVDAIPIWVNMIYSLIGGNNIYNAIALTYEDAPLAMKAPLKTFIEKIELNNDDKEAYITFLKEYEIEGFRDLMMKLYEFRNLSKDKLKYEIYALNEMLGKLEAMKRLKKQKQELFVVDNITMILITIPCMYLFFISLLLSEVMM